MNFVTIIMSTWLVATTFVSADQMTRFIFNGVGTCTSTENGQINAIFGSNLVSSRRALLRGDNQTGSFRSLAYSVECKKNCAGYTEGQCRATGCEGWRGRALQETGERRLLTCSEIIASIHTKLDTLRTSVGTSCKGFIGNRASRTTQCYNDVIYGEVLGARLWEIPSPGTKIIKKDFLPVSGYSFCKSMKFNIESLNDPCVDDALMELKGPGYIESNTEGTAPYTLYGNVGDNFHGRTMNTTGLYTFSITPDYDASKKKTFTFNIINC